MNFSLSEKSLFPALGGLAALICVLFLEIWLTGWALLTLFSVILLFLLFRKKSNHPRRGVGQRSRNVVAAAVGFVLVSLAMETNHFIDQSHSPGIKPQVIHGAGIVLTSDPVIVFGGRWRSVGRILYTESQNITAGARGRIAVIGSGEPKNINNGSIINAKGSLRVSPEDGSLVFYSSKWTFKSWRGMLWEFRHRFIRHLEEQLSRNSKSTAAFFDALLLGRKTDPGLPLLSKIRDAGAMHLLALSGFHLGIIALFVRIVFKPLAGVRAASFVSVLVIFGYLFITGIKPSLLRAVVMYTFWTWDKMRGYRVSALGYLCTAFLFQLILFPRSAAALSFQLSYAALFGLITVGGSLRRFFSRRFPNGVSLALGSALAAQIATLPFVVSAFGIWRPAGLVSSPLLTPFIALAMVIGSAGILLSGESGLFFSVQEKIIFLIERIASLFSRIPGIQMSASAAWLLTAFGFITTIILVKSLRCKTWEQIEPQLPLLHTGISGVHELGSPQEMGAEFSCKSGCKKKDN